MGMLEKFSAIHECRKFTQERLSKLAVALGKIDTQGANLVANGSYARKEASDQSDFDYVVIFPKKVSATDRKHVEEKIREIVRDVIGKMPSEGGAFASPIFVGDLTKDIGGQEDSNDDITHRILFLTEGAPVGDRSLFDAQRVELVERYIQDTIQDHQLALFFLNDVIRYWRTICVDFENKTFEKGKDWGTRNIKLVFSRRLLYFGGVLIAAETAQHTAAEKRRIFTRLAELSPIERLVHVCGSVSERALADYNHFLEEMKKPTTRAILKSVTRVKDQNEDFRRLKNRGHHFASHLISVLQTTYPDSHPIHRALIM